MQYLIDVIVILMTTDIVLSVVTKISIGLTGIKITDHQIVMLVVGTQTSIVQIFETVVDTMDIIFKMIET